ncbi:MAG: type IX secretion system membrane protein PorP/SprF [Muribaculaceae bacterium]|nr:type IX secretion system membrane protein PorP/SprF [Muribaculaceae bacterium]
MTRSVNDILSLLLRLAIVPAMLLAGICAHAQSDAQFSQYYQIKNYYNPAAIGTSDLLNIRGGARLQWVGIDNAPKSFAATAEMPLKLFKKRIGVGVLMQQESLGLYKNLTAGVQAGYKIKLFKGELTAGVQIGFINQSFKGSEVVLPDDDNYHQGTDEAIPTNDLNGNAFDIGVGVYYTRGIWWGGLSMTHATQPVISLKSDTGDSSLEHNYEFQVGRTLYFMAGCNIQIKNTLFEVMPSVLVKSDFTFTTGEATARVRYNKFLTAGIGYRYNDAVTISLGAEIKGFYLGYAYDYATSAIAKASSGSHEIFAGYSLKLDFSEKNKNKHKSIRIL